MLDVKISRRRLWYFILEDYEHGVPLDATSTADSQIPESSL
jgi:hypothetical protein